MVKIMVTGAKTRTQKFEAMHSLKSSKSSSQTRFKVKSSAQLAITKNVFVLTCDAFV